MSEDTSLLHRFLGFFLYRRPIVVVLAGMMLVAGLVTAPFAWDLPWLTRDPVAVDAIPDIGENQQIVFTSWPGRSPQDVDDQITYPLSSALMGLPKVRDVRALSMFGFSSIFIIFDEGAEFYWARSRILEQLASLDPGLLPEEVRPTLGPDATALGQIFWYTIEGRDPTGRPTGGWDLHELRDLQDWTVRQALQAVPGVSEVSSVGGFAAEYQVDVDPDALQAYGLDLSQVLAALRAANRDVGARTIEVNRVEYVLRGRGLATGIDDLRHSVIARRDGVPVRIGDLADIVRGPALRRGVLDKDGSEAVGGVVVARYGANPQAVVMAVREAIAELAPALPQRAVIDWSQVEAETVEDFAASAGFSAWREGDVYEEAWREWLLHHPPQQWPAWLTLSRATVVPFYDRGELIGETIGTLEEALTHQVLITIIVVLLMLMHLRSALVVATVLPMGVLLSFVFMKGTGVDANIVALSGIAIAIGTMVDMGVVMSENIVHHLAVDDGQRPVRQVVLEAASEMASSVLTAVLTTIVSFLPVFFMTGAEGKLFRPLAFTSVFALSAAIIISLTIIPSLAMTVLSRRRRRGRASPPTTTTRRLRALSTPVIALIVALVLAGLWLPLGAAAGWRNHLFVVLLIALLYGCFIALRRFYPLLLAWFLDHRPIFLVLPAALVTAGILIWSSLGREFMPPLDEGSFLYMPTTMVHASIGEAAEVMSLQNRAIRAIPEVDQVVGKIGRVDSALDPAPISMVETVITYRSEYRRDAAGRIQRFAWDRSRGDWRRDEAGDLIPDSRGQPYRQWRDHIHHPDDIWREIVAAAEVPGATSAPKLQPISTRLVMLATGMRAPIGIKVMGPEQATIEDFAVRLEGLLTDGSIPGIDPATVYAERVVGKPYLEIHLDRQRAAQHGIRIADAQMTIQAALGGTQATTLIEGRARYPVRLRYQRERRDSIEDIENLHLPSADGVTVPLREVADLVYVRGPQVIKSENTRLVAYLTLDVQAGHAEVEVVEAMRDYLDELIRSGALAVPTGVSYSFAGNYQHQLHAQQTLAWALPLALALIVLILYLQFRSLLLTLLVFSGVLVSWSGGFVMIWLYGQSWFLDVTILGVNLREVFQVAPLNLSIAVWVGFLGLFGVATDDGVIMATSIRRELELSPSRDPAAIRSAIIAAGRRRIRPALMTIGTTILALIPVLTATGRGADLMIPMAIPVFGGMTFGIITVFVVPVLAAVVYERGWVGQAEG